MRRADRWPACAPYFARAGQLPSVERWGARQWTCQGCLQHTSVPSRVSQQLVALSRAGSAGLKLGIYGDAGTQTCLSFPGSFGHERSDALQFSKCAWLTPVPDCPWSASAGPRASRRARQHLTFCTGSSRQQQALPAAEGSPEPSAAPSALGSRSSQGDPVILEALPEDTLSWQLTEHGVLQLVCGRPEVRQLLLGPHPEGAPGP